MILPERVHIVFAKCCAGCVLCDPVIKDNRDTLIGNGKEFVIGEAIFTCVHLKACERLSEERSNDG